MSPRSKEMLQRLSLMTASLLVAALIGELALRWLQGEPAPQDGPEDGFSFFAHHETLGWDLVPGARDRHHSQEIDVTIRIDRHGLRSHREIFQERAFGVLRVLVIGDSFSFGHGVEIAEAYPAQLEAQLSHTEVVNLAVTGYGTDQQLLRLIDQGLAWQPDFILLGLFEGNIFRNARESYLGYPKPRFILDPQGNLVLRNVPVPPRSEGTLPPRGLARLRLWQLAAGRGRDLYEHLGYGESWEVTAAILKRLSEVSQGGGAELLAVVVPKDQAIYGQGLRRRLHLHTLKKLDALLARLDIEALDLTSTFAASAAARPSEQLYFPMDGHWTAAGHRIAAEAIAQWLIEKRNFSAN